MGLFTKNETKEFKELDSFCGFLDSLMSNDEYISRKAYAKSYANLSDTFNELALLEERSVLQAWCKSNKVDYKKLLQLLNKYKSIHKLVKKHNEDYVNKHLVLDKQYLDEVLFKDDPNIKLDEE